MTLFRITNCDIAAISETWLSASDDAVIADLTPTGFAFLHHPRASRRGGGVGLLYRDNLSVHINQLGNYTSFESMSAVVSNGMTSLEILVMYRPPGYQSFSLFINEFSDLLDEKLYKLSPLVSTGDLNIHLDNLSSQHTQRFVAFHTPIYCGVSKLLYRHFLFCKLRAPVI